MEAGSCILLSPSDRARLDRLELLLKQIAAVEEEREAQLVELGESRSQNAMAPAEAQPSPVALLMGLRGIWPEFAAVLWTEGLCRSFANRRQAGAYGGLTPTPRRRRAIAHERGVSKAGNPPLAQDNASTRVGSWLIHQPQSALARWCRQRLPV
jgi:transposase